jgi:hypothetical protein
MFLRIYLVDTLFRLYSYSWGVTLRVDRARRDRRVECERRCGR